MTAPATRRVGDREVFPVGFGALGLSVEGRPDRPRALRTLHAAFEAGVSLVDTADAYCLGPHDAHHNEELVAEALAASPALRQRVLVATKGGQYRAADGSYGIDARPARLRQACEASLRALRTDTIDLYQLHRPDPEVPFAESVGALRTLWEEGKIRGVGVSNVDADQLREALSIVPVVSVQNRYSPADTASEDVLRLCAERSVASLPWAPLGGLGTRGTLPPAVRGEFEEVARSHGVSVQRTVLAWQLSRSPVVVPLPGTTREAAVRDNVAAVSVRLDDAALTRLERAVSTGARG
jgi:aryl-alcohol dehydrogenase-like predicted oxidoreductase